MNEKTALIIVDMQKDNVFHESRAIIPNIKKLLGEARKRGFLVVFACDSRYPTDSIFKRLNMKPHTIKGTRGIEIIDEFTVEKGDVIVEKRMLSAFFGTDLDFTFRELKIRKVVVAGIVTDICVLKTVLDAWELGYEVIVPRDCVTSFSEERHRAGLSVFKALKIETPTLSELLSSLARKAENHVKTNI